MRRLRVQDTTSGRTFRRRRGIRDAPAIADLGAAPTSPPGGVCEHGFHPFPDLGRLASLDVLRAGSAGLQGRHRATGQQGQRTDDAGTYGWTSRPRALEPAVGVISRLPHGTCPGTGPGLLESTHRWTEQHGLRYLTAPNGAGGPSQVGAG